MKKTIALLTAAIIALVLVAFSTDSTLAYFMDKATAAGADASAGCLEVSVDLNLTNYGVPSDTLLTSYGSKAEPAESTVTVKNEGSADMEYTLSLMVNKETANLLDLDSNGFKLIGADSEPLQFNGNPTTDGGGNVTYIYKSTGVLKTGESDVFGLALTFKGAALIDGNDYQGAEISVTPTVVATQVRTGGAE